MVRRSRSLLLCGICPASASVHRELHRAHYFDADTCTNIATQGRSQFDLRNASRNQQGRRARHRKNSNANYNDCNRQGWHDTDHKNTDADCNLHTHRSHATQKHATAGSNPARLLTKWGSPAPATAWDGPVRTRELPGQMPKSKEHNTMCENGNPVFSCSPSGGAS